MVVLLLSLALLPSPLSAFALRSSSPPLLYRPASAHPRSHGLRMNANSSPDGAALKGFLRGQKCLFDDAELRFGNIIYLLRGADSSQRYVYPLELETNKGLLPGEQAAQVIFDERDAALEEARKHVVDSYGLARDDGGVGQMISEDLGTFLRVLQYGIAAGIVHCMRREVLDYMTELYDEVGMDFAALSSGVRYLRDYFEKRMEAADFTAYAAPCFDRFLENIKLMAEYDPPAFVDVSGPAFVPDVWEEPAEDGTVPTPLLDPLTVDIDSIPEDQRESVLALREKMETSMINGAQVGVLTTV
ncbi:unnamed protein product [Vitrella brassicaformis CCMP3155]|uniref:Uncharacterized protein n=1 Tax=Vitrella brassicaformis (strain CCMP3155) TaxID=1169540 RepID=A0A0G4ENF2_VITBC|nr:unnamed protein product [Vitrella brassicaformis CCMP3155]|eukprot:CEL99027.1 unnamed protein product [Vitrella brassicaformis CCMP3155]